MYSSMQDGVSDISGAANRQIRPRPAAPSGGHTPARRGRVAANTFTASPTPLWLYGRSIGRRGPTAVARAVL